MTIKIRQTPYKRQGGANVGPYEVSPDEVRGQLGVIAMAGSPDLPGSLGETPDADPDYTVISFDPGPQDATTPAGKVRLLLKELVDRGTATTLFGFGPGFVWEDGSTLEGSAGAAIGDWVFYDTKNCDGDGRWVRGTDGNQVCTTSAGVLYHELAHQKLNHPVGTVDQDERAAVEVENQLREAQGLVPRDPDHWPESQCGCPADDCCIMASVASGSPFSAEVQALRRLRDGLLRDTAFGRRFFLALHREYYGFSVPVCRVMVGSAQARQSVEDWLVRPLVRVLGLADRHVRRPHDAAALIELLQGVVGSGGGDPFEAAAVGGVLDSHPTDPATAKVAELTLSALPGCPHVRWAILEPIGLYAEMCQRLGAGATAERAAAWIAGAFDAWLARIPLEEVAQAMTPDALCADLETLSRTVFRAPATRAALGPRVLRAVPRLVGSAGEARLRAAGYLP